MRVRGYWGIVRGSVRACKKWACEESIFLCAVALRVRVSVSNWNRTSVLLPYVMMGGNAAVADTKSVLVNGWGQRNVSR